MTGSRSDVDQAGCPVLLSFTTDLNLGAGVFGESNTQVPGTVAIHYRPTSRPSPGGFEEGVATAVFKAGIFTVGTNNPPRNADLVSRGGRVARRS